MLCIIVVIILIMLRLLLIIIVLLNAIIIIIGCLHYRNSKLQRKPLLLCTMVGIYVQHSLYFPIRRAHLSQRFGLFQNF